VLIDDLYQAQVLEYVHPLVVLAVAGVKLSVVPYRSNDSAPLGRACWRSSPQGGPRSMCTRSGDPQAPFELCQRAQ
jgi:hypothetical protein